VRWIKRFAVNERGGTLIEYGLIVALIVIAIMGSLQAFASKSIGMWNNVASKVNNAG
jgi:pilus assembly protein Flp/PilA